MFIRRLSQLIGGLALYGAGMALLVRANLGLDPWDVLHQGVAERVSWSFGMVVCATGAAVLLLWIPLRQKPGPGTVANVFVIGIAADAALAVLPTPQALVTRVLFLLGGVLVIGVAGGAYIGAGFGPGPRDGLMTGLVARTGWSIRATRTLIELAVLAVGFALGGTVGVGTVIFALAIGPLVHVFLPLFTVKPRPAGADAARAVPSAPAPAP